MINALLVALTLSAASAEDDAAATAKAKTLFTNGQKLYKAGKYADAIAKFEEAFKVKSHPVIYFNIGKCWEQLGDSAKALRNFRDYLRLSPDASDRQQVTDSIANLERRLREKGVQQLLIFAEPANAKIVVDGKDLGPSPASVELTAGSHELVVTAEGMDKVQRTITTTLTRATEMTITLQAAGSTPPLVSDAPKKDPDTKVGDPGPPPPPPPVVTVPTEKKGGRLFTYVAGGVAVAALGAGIGMGVAAEANAKELRETKEPLVDGRADQLAQSANGLATGANVAYATAGAALVVAVILFFVEK
jgi:PEGA domain